MARRGGRGGGGGGGDRSTLNDMFSALHRSPAPSFYQQQHRQDYANQRSAQRDMVVMQARGPGYLSVPGARRGGGRPARGMMRGGGGGGRGGGRRGGGGGRGGRGGRRGGKGKSEPPKTAEELDADLDSYMCGQGMEKLDVGESK
eukprot:TRINITY_DN893_c1_g2_i2.p1 TRINITY_DN893_c1_g2~~TRINITY_DN893_c1_g2_i2.p1  ORF type:complete len:145 (-),score=69.90 TRINITY_DN893_c1_g2_i2:118-552(-)